ncbi:MAG: hypothetical protein ACI360_06145 [Atopobiaceae bacterium]
MRGMKGNGSGDVGADTGVGSDGFGAGGGGFGAGGESTSHRRSSPRQQLVMKRLQCLEQYRLCLCPTSEAERKALARLIRSGTVVKVGHGVYARAEWWNAMPKDQQHVCLARTFSAQHPDWAFCGPTAAAVWGLSPSFGALDQLHVAFAGKVHHPNRGGIRCYQLDSELCRHDDLPVTSPERTVLDCARTMPFAEGLAIADAAARIFRWSDYHFLDYLMQMQPTKLHGFHKAVLVALFVDGKSENGGESVARASMILQGFALPQLQLSVSVDVDGRRRWYRVDFAWPKSNAAHATGNGLRVQGNGARASSNAARASSNAACFLSHGAGSSDNDSVSVRWIFGELDGRQKYENPAMLQGRDTTGKLLDERRREAELTKHGSVVRFGYAEAADPVRLGRNLDGYDVPRVCGPLEMGAGWRRAIQDALLYLQRCAEISDSARRRLNQVRKRKLL